MTPAQIQSQPETTNRIVELEAQVALNQRAADFYESEGWRVIDDALRDAEAELAAARRSAAGWQRAAERWRAEAISNSRRSLIDWLLRKESRDRRNARRAALGLAPDDTPIAGVEDDDTGSPRQE